MVDPNRDASGPEENGDDDQSHEERRERIRATAQDLLRELDNPLPGPLDPYPAIPTKLSQYPPFLRQWLQKLTPEYIRTLDTSVLSIQRTGSALRKIRRLVAWMLGAFGLMVAFGKDIAATLQMVGDWLR